MSEPVTDTSARRAEPGEAVPGERPVPTDAESRATAPRRGRRKSRFWRGVRRALVYYLGVAPADAVISCLPLPAARALGRGLGTIAYLTSGKERRMALDNLRHAFGEEKTEREIRRIARRSFQNMSVTMTESIAVQRWSKEKLDRVFGLEEAIRELHDGCEGGAVGIAAHFGNWELIARLVNVYHPGFLVAVARTHSNPYIDAHVARKRERAGVETLYTDASPRRFIEVVKGGRLLGLLPDQHLRTPNGIFVPFFGRPAYTTTIPANLARSTKKKIILGLMAREGSGYEVIFRTILEPEWTGDRQADLRRATEILTRELETEFRRRPEQWAWFHDRWRSKPGDEARYSRPRWTRGLSKQRQKRDE